MNPCDNELSISVMAPLGRDAQLISDVLKEQGYRTALFGDVVELAGSIDETTGVVVVTEEALAEGKTELFHRSLAHQPPWSDIPVLLLARSRNLVILQTWVAELAKSTSNLTLLERPVRILTLTSVVKVAMRSRHRQLQLRNVLLKLEEVNRSKDRFLASLSHELRTPLTPALLAANALEQMSGLPVEAYKETATVRNSIEIQARLVDDLLDLSRIIHGKLMMVNEPVDVHEVLDQCILATRRLQKASKGMEFQLQLCAHEHTVNGDRARLTQIFMNLLTNAVKFTPEAGVIRLESSNPAPGSISICIVDNGIGLNEEQRSRIFDAFEQGGEQITRRHGGLGLGLAICKGLVEAHAGEISACSAGPGLGTTFQVQLPVTSQPIPATRSSNGYEIGHPRVLRILVVEDDRETAETLSRLLSRAGHHPLTAGSRADAERLAENEELDFVLSDLGLPDGSGHELMQNLHQRFGLRGIALSGFGTLADQQLSQSCGFVTHLTKPVQWEALREAIRKSMNYQIDHFTPE